jgi:hypothetical protein
MSEQLSLLLGLANSRLRMTGCGLPLGIVLPYAAPPTDGRNCRMNMVDINFDYLNANLV